MLISKAPNNQIQTKKSLNKDIEFAPKCWASSKNGVPKSTQDLKSDSGPQAVSSAAPLFPQGAPKLSKSSSGYQNGGT